MPGFNPYIEFLKNHKQSGLSREELLAKYHASQGHQIGGDADRKELREWWDYVQGRIGMSSNDQDREQFIDHLIQVSDGRPITRTIFTIAHSMWYGNGNISPEIFGDKKQQLTAINSWGRKYTSIIEFVQDYLDQMKGYEGYE